jgi:hypothetical protein
MYGANFVACRTRRDRERKRSNRARLIDENAKKLEVIEVEARQLNATRQEDERVRYLRNVLKANTRLLVPPSKRRRVDSRQYQRFRACGPSAAAHAREVIPLAPFTSNVHVELQPIDDVAAAALELNRMEANAPRGFFDASAITEREIGRASLERRRNSAKARKIKLAAEKRELDSSADLDTRLEYLDDEFPSRARVRRTRPARQVLPAVDEVFADREDNLAGPYDDLSVRR